MSIAVVQFAEKHTWIFDCGDGTQRQMTNAKFVKSKLQAIFITHLHGDHVGLSFHFFLTFFCIPPHSQLFGLPSLVSDILFMDDTIEVVRIFGPVGLAGMTSIHFSIQSSTSS
jgi:ribonuclease Z